MERDGKERGRGRERVGRGVVRERLRGEGGDRRSERDVKERREGGREGGNREGGDREKERRRRKRGDRGERAVSYTHLTLPTNAEV